MSKSFVKKYGLIICPLIIFLVVREVFDFNGLYGQDSHEYLRYAIALKNYLAGGPFPGDYYWPVNYPIMGALLSFIFQDVALSMQLLSLGSFILLLYVLRKILLLLYPSGNNIESYLLISVIPAAYFMRASLFCMSDMTAACFIILSFYFFIVQKNNGKARCFVIVTLFYSLAVFTRYACFMVLFFPFLASFYLFIRKFNFNYLILSLALAVAVAIPQLFIKVNHLAGMTDNFLFESWSVNNFFNRNFNTLDGISENKVINLFYALSNFVHPGYFIYGIILIPFMTKKELTGVSLLITISIFAYAVFLMGLPFQNMRFLLLTFPFIVIFFFPVFQRAVEFYKIRFKYFNFIILFLFCAQGATFIYSFRFFYFRNRMEKHISATIKKYPVEKKLYTFSLDPALKSYQVKNPIKNLWEQKYSSFEKGSLVLFNPGGLEEQWKGKNPMINWDAINKEYHLKVLENFEDGWKLYEIN